MNARQRQRQHPDDRTAVEFRASSRLHVSIAVQDVGRSRAFYEVLFGSPPTKIRPGHVKFDLDDPSVNLALHQISAAEPAPGPARGAHHFGIQVKATSTVLAARERLASAGISTEVKERNECCNSVQTKIWAHDPDGNPWEIFVVVDDRVESTGADDDKVDPDSRSVAAGCCESLEGCG